MPQMSPLNWISLFLMFSSLFIILMMMNYYIFMYNPHSPQMKKNKIKLNWKW
uniref:ATP synthase complex subunit 8 n=2 Tax=unclassified Curculionoidea TaxID=201752 RepID=A0A346RIT6_9CUCU|nr:ATP synthase F0 subunit 8 [Curculionoidea sp. 6 KM-2017]AXS65993.1 ATP synthase F0 subunit 8 [Curculionoidea sp. 5 KM-2017]